MLTTTTNNVVWKCCLKKHVHCKHVFLVDDVVALIPSNEFQLFHCFHAHILNKMTNIENQQCQQQQQMMLFANGIKKKCMHCKCVLLFDDVVVLIPNK